MTDDSQRCFQDLFFGGGGVAAGPPRFDRAHSAALLPCEDDRSGVITPKYPRSAMVFKIENNPAQGVATATNDSAVNQNNAPP